MNDRVVIASACRTPIGKMGGALSSVSAVDLGAVAIKETISRAGISSECIDEVIMGCVLQTAQGQNVARQAAIKAGIPVSVPAQTLNIVCGSGLKAVNLASALIRSGEAEVVLAGGMENMSCAPYALPQARFGYRLFNGELVDTLVKDGLWDAMNDYHMGITAENVAKKYGISRQEQDAYALQSQLRCQKAETSGEFRDEIVPVPVVKKGVVSQVTEDEAPRFNMTMEQLAKLKPVFMQNGTVTAGNASGINDGAAVVLVMSEKKAISLGIQPMAVLQATATAGVDPAYMGIGPVAATKIILEKIHADVDSFDLIELNEAFASQTLAVMRDLDLDASKTNINGGAIALGHPVGASGCRILVTLLYSLRHRNLKTGLATLCVGGGMGVAAAVTLM